MMTTQNITTILDRNANSLDLAMATCLMADHVGSMDDCFAVLNNEAPAFPCVEQEARELASVAIEIYNARQALTTGVSAHDVVSDIYARMEEGDRRVHVLVGFCISK
jgi:hypothetical protein